VTSYKHQVYISACLTVAVFLRNYTNREYCKCGDNAILLWIVILWQLLVLIMNLIVLCISYHGSFCWIDHTDKEHYKWAVSKTTHFISKQRLHVSPCSMAICHISSWIRSLRSGAPTPSFLAHFVWTLIRERLSGGMFLFCQTPCIWCWFILTKSKMIPIFSWKNSTF
jgi:hypothetical protein